MTYQDDPNHIGTIRTKLNAGSRDIILLQEILEYLKESLMVTLPAPAAVDSVGSPHASASSHAGDAHS